MIQFVVVVQSQFRSSYSLVRFFLQKAHTTLLVKLKNTSFLPVDDVTVNFMYQCG